MQQRGAVVGENSKGTRGHRVDNCIIFNGIGALDFQEVRLSVIRLPEVSIRISEAQAIWDKSMDEPFNFHNFFTSEDRVFLSNIRLKGLAVAIVQVGLFDRISKKQGAPQFMVGNTKSDSALKVCVGKMSFAEMIFESSAAGVASPERPLRLANEPLLSGISLEEFSAYKAENGEFERVESNEVSECKLVEMLIEEYGVRNIIHVGPGVQTYDKIIKEFELRDVSIVDFIESDPMLTWFWDAVKSEDTYQLAQ